ncbi:MAG: cobalamin B12-binding domain-containing protein [Coriobacteriia bacterium]|nr:cobalamin B12-binding domain-containing protein [Coriobacteriia bacterium]
MADPTQGTTFADNLRTGIQVALAKRDRVGAVERALDAVHAGDISIVSLYVDVLSPLLAGIGSAWSHGKEQVWEEHFDSHTVRTIVESLYLDVQRESAKVTPRGERVLLACPPREQHELGLRMLSDRFQLAGYDVTFLGADTPLDQIIAAAKATDANLVALSVSTVFERVELRTFVDSLRAQLPGARIVIGGPAFSRDQHWPSEDFLDTHELGLFDPATAG